MAEFKRSVNTTGKFKGISVIDGNFLYSDTGEAIDVARILEEVYGSGQPFDLSTTQKSDDAITPNE